MGVVLTVIRVDETTWELIASTQDDDGNTIISTDTATVADVSEAIGQLIASTENQAQAGGLP